MFRTITKIVAAAAIATTGVAGKMAYDDFKASKIEDIQPIGDVVPEADTQDAADQIINSAEV
ncbi:MAG: hypothetical protein PUJ51_08630 [Clostridiales bacterium]|nr:hypothetical protein [Clostridiales bacterium]